EPPHHMVGLGVSREPAEAMHHDEADALPILTAVTHEVLELGSVRCLRRFPLLHEDAINLDSLAAAVFLACLALSRQAEVLDLLLRRHPAVDHRAHRSAPLRRARCSAITRRSASSRVNPASNSMMAARSSAAS